MHVIASLFFTSPKGFLIIEDVGLQGFENTMKITASFFPPFLIVPRSPCICCQNRFQNSLHWFTK